MKHLLLISATFCFFLSLHAQNIPEKEWQLSTAVLAAPEDDRENATILGYDADGEVVTLREGTNNFVCLASKPGKEQFNAACYHKELEPYMARGRELRKQGMSFQQAFDQREEEVKSKKLSMPDKSTLYVLSGTVTAEGKVEDTYLRYVIYIPYATAESTGLPLSPASTGGPWIMDPGTHRAHIMINPPKD